MNPYAIICKTHDLYLRQFSTIMSNPKRFNISLSVLQFVAGDSIVFVFQFVKDQLIRDAIVSSVQNEIFVTVSGNVRVLAERSFTFRNSIKVGICR